MNDKNNKFNIKAIIFDFDGVLFDSEKTHWQAFNQILAAEKIEMTEEDYFQYYIGLSDYEIFHKVSALHQREFASDKIAVLHQQKVKAYQALLANGNKLQSLRGVHEFILNCKQTINQFAICTSSSKNEINSTLACLDNGSLRQHFNYIVTIDDVRNGKPNPEGYLLALKKLQLKAQDCLVIEDSPNGIKAAKAANIRVAGITTTHEADALSAADVVVSRFEDISVYISSGQLLQRIK